MLLDDFHFANDGQRPNGSPFISAHQTQNGKSKINNKKKIKSLHNTPKKTRALIGSASLRTSKPYRNPFIVYISYLSHIHTYREYIVHICHIFFSIYVTLYRDWSGRHWFTLKQNKIRRNVCDSYNINFYRNVDVVGDLVLFDFIDNKDRGAAGVFRKQICFECKCCESCVIAY